MTYPCSAPFGTAIPISISIFLYCVTAGFELCTELEHNVWILRGEPERAPNRRETGNTVCMHIFVCDLA